MPEDPGERRAEAESELARARAVLGKESLSEGDLRHAAEHVARAIAGDPSFRDAYTVLDELTSRSGDAPDLFRGAGGTVYIGAAAARSYLLARSGDPDGAFTALCAVAREEPGKPWADGWLSGPDGPSLAAKSDPHHAATALSRLAWSLPDPVGVILTETLAPFLEAARRIADGSTDPEVLPALSALARRLGAGPEAISWCERAEQAGPSARTAIMLGYALRDAGRRTDMYKAWRRAYDRDKKNIDLCVDIAENLAADGRPKAGLTWLEKGLALESGHPKAFPSACQMRYRLDGDVAHLVRLADWWRDHPEYDYADQMLAKACDQQPWLSRVPAGSEATAGMLRYVAQHEKSGETVKVKQTALSALEVPSVMALARARGIRTTGLRTGWDPATPEPSIRKPVAEGKYRLWTYTGSEARPVPPEPSPEATGQLQAVGSAGDPWHPVAAYQRAAGLAGLSVNDLLSLLAHDVPAPATPDWENADSADPTYWRRSAQAWACLGLLHEAPDEPWDSSVRRTVLVDLLRGVEDWATDAAMNALVVAAWMDPDVRPDVAGLVAGRFAVAAAASEQRVVSIIEPMAHLVLATPDMPLDTRRLARKTLQHEARKAKDRPGPGRRLFRP